MSTRSPVILNPAALLDNGVVVYSDALKATTLSTTTLSSLASTDALSAVVVTVSQKLDKLDPLLVNHIPAVSIGGTLVDSGFTTTSIAPLASPTFTGTPAAPTASAGTSTTQLATTAFVTTADNLKANLASPTFTGTPEAPTAAAGTATIQIATTAYVNTATIAIAGQQWSPTPTGGLGTDASPWTGWQSAFITALAAGTRNFFIPKGVWAITAPLDITQSFVWLHGEPGSVIKNIGTGTQQSVVITNTDTVNNPPLSPAMPFSQIIEQLALDGNDNCKNALYVRHSHHLELRNLVFLGATEIDFLAKWCVILNMTSCWSCVHQKNLIRPTAIMAPKGLFFTDDHEFTGGPSAVTSSNITNTIVEGHSGDGVTFEFAEGVKVNGGTWEGNGGAGVYCTSDAVDITIQGVDFESNGASVLNGTGCTIADGFFGDPLTIGSTATDTTIRNLGHIGTLTNNGLDTRQQGCVWAAMAGTAPLGISNARPRADGQYFSGNAKAGDVVDRQPDTAAYRRGFLGEAAGSSSVSEDIYGVTLGLKASLPTNRLIGRRQRWKGGEWFDIDGTDYVRVNRRLTAEDYINSFDPVFATWWGERTGAVLHDAGVNLLGAGSLAGGYTQGQAGVFAENAVTGTLLNGTTGYGKFAYNAAMQTPTTACTWISVFNATSSVGHIQQIQDQDDQSAQRRMQMRIRTDNVAEIILTIGTLGTMATTIATGATVTGGVCVMGFTYAPGNVDTSAPTGLIGWVNGVASGGFNVATPGGPLAVKTADLLLGKDGAGSSFFSGTRYFDAQLPVAWNATKWAKFYKLMLTGYGS